MLEQFLKMPISRKLLILGVFMALIGIVFWQFYYNPLVEQYEQLTRQHKKLKSKQSKIEQRKKTYDEDLQKREDLKIASVKQRQMLPVETEMASFLKTLNTVADLSGLEIQSVKREATSPEKYYARIPVKLELEGNYLQLAKFFYQVGKTDRIINIENINLSKPEVDETGVIIAATVLATTFRALEKNASGKRKGR